MLLTCLNMTLVRKWIAASMLSWMSLIVKVKTLVSCPQLSKLLKHGCISSALLQRMMAWSPMRKAWIKKFFLVCKKVLPLLLVCWMSK